MIEYVAVRLTEPVEWIWNRLIDGKFSVIETADNELIMSTSAARPLDSVVRSEEPRLVGHHGRDRTGREPGRPS